MTSAVILRLLASLFGLAAVGWLIYFLCAEHINPIPAAVFAALAGVFLTEASRISDRSVEKSKFYLESVTNGYKEALTLLSDGNNDRVTWVSAARILDHAQSISKKITVQEHKDIHQIALKKYRHEFVQVLGFDNSSKSGAFFYGAGDSKVPIDQAAADSTDPTKGKNKGLLSDLKAISESTLYVIWQFCQSPKNIEEPLRGKFSDEEIENMRPLWPGLHEYLTHIRAYFSVAGELHKKNNDEKGA